VGVAMTVTFVGSTDVAKGAASAREVVRRRVKVVRWRNMLNEDEEVTVVGIIYEGELTCKLQICTQGSQ